MLRVLFVCLGNICRSPTAQGVLQLKLEQRGLAGQVEVDSAGTAAWHVGKSPDSRSTAAAAQRGYDLTSLRARQVNSNDFDTFDYVLAMDEDNLHHLRRLKMPASDTDPCLFLQTFRQQYSIDEVPDPYYGGADGFEQVLDLLEDACEGLLLAMEPDLRQQFKEQPL